MRRRACAKTFTDFAYYRRRLFLRADNTFSLGKQTRHVHAWSVNRFVLSFRIASCKRFRVFRSTNQNTTSVDVSCSCEFLYSDVIRIYLCSICRITYMYMYIWFKGVVGGCLHFSL